MCSSDLGWRDKKWVGFEEDKQQNAHDGSDDTHAADGNEVTANPIYNPGSDRHPAYGAFLLHRAFSQFSNLASSASTTSKGTGM